MKIELQATAVTVWPLRETRNIADELHQKAVLSKREMNDELRFIFRIDNTIYGKFFAQVLKATNNDL